jgi:hypothetical protein
LTVTTTATALAATYPITVSNSGNAVTGVGTLTVNQKALVPGITASSKVYDGDTTATITSRSLTGIVVGDNVSLSGGIATFSDKNADNGKTVTGSGFTLSGAQAANYFLSPTTASTTADITPLALTVSGITANNKVYDGNTTATLNTGSAALVGVVGSDDVTLDSSGAVGTFDTAAVGTGKSVTVSGLTLSGADAGNYSLTQPTTTADITAKALTVSGITANNKVYDGTTTATLNTGSAALVGVVGSDDVTLDVSGAVGTFASANVGTWTVTISGLVITGADAGNYSLTQPTTTASITGATLTVTGITTSNKIYDGTTAAALDTTGATLVGVVSGDDVTLDVSGAVGTFDTAAVGTGKIVAVSGLTISGADAGKYSLTQPTTTADITAKALTVSGITADNKVYDGNTTATLNMGSAALVGVVGSDDVTLDTSGAVGAFDTANVGTGKTVTVSGLVLTGADAGNYSLTQPTTTADITAKALTISGITADDKVYDGTAAATLSGTPVLNGVVSGDTVNLGGTPVATFADKNVGNGKTVNVTGYTISGADAANYTLTQPTLSADITPLAIVGSITANNKVYDGTTAATIAGRSLSGVISGDVVSYVGGTATFSDANVGNGKTVTAVGLSLSGADAGNYTVNTTAVTTADITPASTTTSLVSSANPSVFGSSVTFTATVAPSGATGTVQFYADGATLGSAQSLSGSGTASVNTSSLAVGTHVITTTYTSSSANYTGSTSAELSQVVSPACDLVSNVDFTFLPTVPKVGQSVNFTAVASGTAPITYTWNFGHGANVETTSAVTAHSFPLTTTVQTYNVSLTAANACTSATTPVVKPVTVWPYLVYLPIIMR